MNRASYRLAVWAAVVVAGCLTLLLADYIVAVARVPGEASRIELLETQVKTDDEVAPLLEAERELQTARSLARKSRARWAAWIMLVAGGLFVAGAKSHTGKRPAPRPSLERLVADRFPPATPAFKGSRDAAPGESGVDLEFVDQLVERHGKSGEAAIPILQAIQTHYRYLPDEALRRVCETTEITPAQIAGTSSFYAQFRRSPVGRHVVRVCHGTACHVAGAEQITGELRRHLGIEEGQDTDPARRFTIDEVACVGCCSLAPVMMIEEETAGRLTPATARRTLEALEPEA